MTATRSLMDDSLAAKAPGIKDVKERQLAYNKMQGDVARTQARMESFADEFSSILSRQIDQHTAGNRDRAA